MCLYRLLTFSEVRLLILLENFKFSFNYQLLFREAFPLFCSSILGLRSQEFLNSPNKIDLLHYHFSYSFTYLSYSCYIDILHLTMFINTCSPTDLPVSGG